MQHVTASGVFIDSAPEEVSSLLLCSEAALLWGLVGLMDSLAAL